MYYIVEIRYSGPNQDEEEYIDAHYIEIRTEPARKNMSREPCVEGWCGTTNDWWVYAHGEYATLEEARAAVREIFGDTRTYSDADADYDDAIIESYKPGKYAPITSGQTSMFAYDAIRHDIGADTTDEQIDALIRQYEAEANNDPGATLDFYTLEKEMKAYRQELRDEATDFDSPEP